MPKYNCEYENGTRTIEAANENAAAELARSVWGEDPQTISLAVEEAPELQVKEFVIQSTVNLPIAGEPLIRAMGSLTVMPEKGYLTIELSRDAALVVADQITNLQADLTLDFQEIVE